MRYHSKKCSLCGTNFTSSQDSAKYCSSLCRNRQKWITWHKKHPNFLWKVERQCAHKGCTNRFIPSVRHHIYCKEHNNAFTSFKAKHPTYWQEYRKKHPTRRKPKIESEKKRYCRAPNCGALIRNGNWWYCAECHSKMSKNLDDPNHVYPVIHFRTGVNA